MKTRYAITHINREGLRVLSSANQGRNHFDTEQAAKNHLAAMLKPETNRPHVLASVFGRHYTETMRVDPVRCYDHGDACACVFGYFPAYDETRSRQEADKLAAVMASV